MSKIIKVATGALIGAAIGYGLSKFVLKQDVAACKKKALILAAFGAAYMYLRVPEITSNASGKKSKQKDVASPKGKKYKPNSWYQDSNGKYHWVNNKGILID